MDRAAEVLRTLWVALSAAWWGPKVLVSTGILALGWAVRRIVLARVHRGRLDPDDRLRWAAAGRNAVIALTALALALVWAEQIHEVLLSVVAIAAALVLATKEFLLCLSGATYVTFSRAFQVGDRIEVSGWRGDVVDLGPLATTLLEVGPGQGVNQASGRSVVVPNSVFLTHAVVNETFTDQFVLHPFSIGLHRTDDWQRAEALLLEAAAEACAPFLEEARSFLKVRLERYSVTPVSVDPRVQLRLSDPDVVELLVRVPCPARQKGRIEQAIVRRFLEGSRPQVDESG